MRLLKTSVVLLAGVLLAGCQSLGGPEGATLNGTAVEEPFVATDEPARVGREHFARGNYALAGRYFQVAVEKEPRDGDAWIGLAASYDQLGRFDLADRAYERVVQIKGQTPQVLNNRGYSYLLRGDAVQAERMFQRARALNPENQTISNNIALLKRAPR